MTGVVGDSLMEGPGDGDDVGEVGLLGFPSELLVGFVAGGDADGGVAGAAVGDGDREVASGDAVNGLNDQ